MNYCKIFIFNQQNDVFVSLHTIFRFLFSSLLSLPLICLPWNIHESGQYLNCDSIKAVKSIRLFLNRRNLATLVKAISFLLAFEQILDTCFPSFRLLSNVISRSLTSLLSQAISQCILAQICPFVYRLTFIGFK